METFLTATAGGAIAFAATSLGAGLFLLTQKVQIFKSWRLSMDFALGLMVSAAAFSLLGPVTWQARGDQHTLSLIGLGFYAGLVAVAWLKRFAERQTAHSTNATEKGSLLLAIVLMAHNFPEGLASGAALGGLNPSAALPVLASVALQNIPEGLLMVVCLRSLGMSSGWALLGGFGSGLVELTGGMIAGGLLQWTQSALPFVIAAAGGAMLSSVAIELFESGQLKERLLSLRFTIGLISVPILSQLIG